MPPFASNDVPIWSRPRIAGLRLALLLMAATSVLDAGQGRADERPIDFNRDIRPLLSDRCFACHGPDAENRQADLRLDEEEAAKEYAIVAGAPEDSELVARITSDDPDLRMPPAHSGKELSRQEIQLLTRWVAAGAPWSAHWAYVPPRRHPVPPAEDTQWPLNWIDHFVLARLRSEGLQPAPEADRVTLVRRLHFDLTGLPPAVEDVEAFVADQDPAAYENLVDRLLRSPHFGERMAMYWLDLVRYADTVGYHGDQDHNISPYRDWVIDAFNRNMPFDAFTKAQLAGDLLPDRTIDDRIATGYNRLLQTSHEGGVQPKEYLAIYAADRVRNVSGVWMGATMGCCQCHDHKYDPYTMRDFYSLAAFFADIDEAEHLRRGTNNLPTERAPEIKVLTRLERLRIEQIEARREAVKQQLEAVKQRLEAVTDRSAESPDREAVASEMQALEAEQQRLVEQRQEIERQARVTMITEAIEPRTMRVLPRGNWLDESGPIVQPAVPAFLGALDTPDRRANRLDLADWLTDAESGVGGLTARVQVNRFWYLLLGSGIAPALDDFGGQGKPPVHPQLLDNLAREFVDSGWNVKHMLKLIVMSRTYRQSSRASETLLESDPYNHLFARQSRYRLPAEAVRDNALAISGLLVREIGGASVRPYQPEGYYRHLNFPKRSYQHHADRRQWRRGLYMHWQRQFLHPMLRVLDAPSREECTAQRPRSNTPLAALTLLNDPTFVEAARVFAERIMRHGGAGPDDRLDYAMRRAVSRVPDAFERQALERLLDGSRDEYQAQPQAARELIATGQAAVAEDLDPVELAAWTTVARAILNLNETITRN